MIRRAGALDDRVLEFSEGGRMMAEEVKTRGRKRRRRGQKGMSRLIRAVTHLYQAINQACSST